MEKIYSLFLLNLIYCQTYTSSCLFFFDQLFITQKLGKEEQLRSAVGHDEARCCRPRYRSRFHGRGYRLGNELSHVRPSVQVKKKLLKTNNNFINSKTSSEIVFKCSSI